MPPRPTGSALTAVSLRSGRLASARSASSSTPAVVCASAMTVHLRRKNRIRRYSHGMPMAMIGGAATAMASSTASHEAVVSS